MRKLIAIAAFVLLSAPASAQSLSDKWLLSQDPTFESRVQMSMVAAAVSITNEATTVALHGSRDGQSVTILLDNTGIWQRRFALAVAVDATVSSQATQAGTVALTPNVTTCNTASPPVCTTTGNQSAQAAMVTDAAINNAVSAAFNSFFQH